MGKIRNSNIYRILTVAFAIVMTFAMSHDSHAAKGTYLTRSGNYVGVKDVPVNQSIDYTMRAVGVPDQCRNQAHDILKQYVIYGLEDDPQFNPKITIMCAFNVSRVNPAGFMGQAIGTRGTVGDLKYIKFENVTRKVERYTLDIAPEPARTSSLWNKILTFVTAAPPAGQLACQSNGNCSQSAYLMTPVSNYSVRSGFGRRNSPTAGASSNHKGVDLAANCGTPIQAAADGVASSRFQGTPPVGTGYGRWIEIQHGNGDSTRYGHLQRIVKTGQVRKGETIALMGGAPRTAGAGSSTSCHLHFEFRKNGVPQEPLAMLGDGPAPTLNATQLANLGTNIAAIDQSLIGLESYEGGALNDGSTPSSYCSTSVNGKCPRDGAEMDAYLEALANAPPMD